MKIKQLSIAALFISLICVFVSCGKTQDNKEQAKTQTKENKVLSVDSLLMNADSLVDKTIIVEDICTHICAHGGRKLFLSGNDNNSIRVEAGEFGSFDTNCPNNIIRIKGILKKDDIDKTNNLAKENNGEKHGEGEGGCSSEKKANKKYYIIAESYEIQK